MKNLLGLLSGLIAFACGIAAVRCVDSMDRSLLAPFPAYTENEVTKVSICELTANPAAYDRRTVRVNARTKYRGLAGSSGLYDNDGEEDKCGRAVRASCGDNRKCRMIGEQMEGDLLIDLEFVLTGVFYADTPRDSESPLSLLRVTGVNWVSEYQGRVGTGTGQGTGHGSGESPYNR